MPNLTILHLVNLCVYRSVNNGSFSGVDGGTLKLSTSQLQCGCGTYHALKLSAVMVTGTAVCSFPPEVFYLPAQLFLHDLFTIMVKLLNILHLYFSQLRFSMEHLKRVSINAPHHTEACFILSKG